MTLMPKISATIEKAVLITNAMLVESPDNPKLKMILLSLEDVKNEFSKPELNKNNIKHLSYGITRVFQDMLEFENTPFGEGIGELLIELNRHW